MRSFRACRRSGSAWFVGRNHGGMRWQEFGRSPQKGVSTSGANSADGRDHWPYCWCHGGAGIKQGYVHGESDKTGSRPLDKPIHPRELLATIYHGFGIDPESIVYNHLNQPRNWSRHRPSPSFLPDSLAIFRFPAPPKVLP